MSLRTKKLNIPELHPDTLNQIEKFLGEDLYNENIKEIDHDELIHSRKVI